MQRFRVHFSRRILFGFRTLRFDVKRRPLLTKSNTSELRSRKRQDVSLFLSQKKFLRNFSQLQGEIVNLGKYQSWFKINVSPEKLEYLQFSFSFFWNVLANKTLTGKFCCHSAIIFENGNFKKSHLSIMRFHPFNQKHM